MKFSELIVYSGTATTVTVQSLSTNVAVEIRSPVEPLSGVACDAWNENVYWAAGQFPAKFYQAKFDGSEIGSALANSFSKLQVRIINVSVIRKKNTEKLGHYFCTPAVVVNRLDKWCG